MAKLIIGDSTRGYDIAEVTKNQGKCTIITGTHHGRITWLKKAVANVNKSSYEFVTPAGDVLPVRIID